MSPDVSVEALRAIAHPGRRAMLRLVWDQERPATELADAAGLSKSATSQHLKLLRDAGLVLELVPASRVVFTYGWERGAHHGGWTHYLDRLRRRAEGSTVGPDPLATRRVPTPAELRR